MAIAGVIVKMKTGSSETVRHELDEMKGVDVEMTTPQGEFILIVEADNIENLHKACVKIEKMNGVLGVYPSYITTEDGK